ncbi:DUF2785 domain-containing protein [Streptomyces hirsutus]|uniref:DUF2785 domain-containing protein n=1 Tax=Streptomyces hirsutus TaxID=35620 RepID=A0ABZ1GPU2_9ACTN|nr:DUF2785 domain-containing protein [Streptomyces hirsutus]WSD07159.1 DUF2785 domain-containing protein [Streptomyces hirsutus]
MSADLVDWASIAAADFPFPKGIPASQLAVELSAMLVSPDPEIRDDYAYTGAARWIGKGHFDEVLEVLGDTAASRFTHPEVQARTFAPLILCSVLTRGHTVPGLVPKEAAERWYARFSAWYLAEQDTRGWDNSLGWLHAVAHGADAAAAFAKALPDRRTELLELCAHRITAKQTDYRYRQLEDARLARALTRILQAPGLNREEATGWLTVVVAALDGGGPGPVPVWAFNTFATLQSLHLHLTRGLADEGTPPHAEAVAARACDLLRVPYYWLD